MVGLEHCGQMGLERLGDWFSELMNATRTGPSTTHSMLREYAGGHISLAIPKTDDLPLPTRETDLNDSRWVRFIKR